MALFAVLVAVSGCLSSEVTQLGPTGPAKAAGCPLALFPSREPDYPIADIAYVHVECYYTGARSRCLEALQERACAMGGDTIYGVKETATEQTIGMSAVVARRDMSAPRSRPAAALATAAAPDGCTPPCSPGFACQERACIPQCNPRCDAGEVCNNHRTCERAAAPARP
jgi:hypothetical protein